MIWTKQILYWITFFLLGTVSYQLLIKAYTSIMHIGWYVTSSSELNVLISWWLELIISLVVLLTFFIPIGKDKDDKNNIYYLVDSMANAINSLFTNWNESKEVRNKTWLYFIFNFLAYLSIISTYIYIIFKLSSETNWLKALIILLFTLILVKVMDEITWIIRQIDLQKQDTWNLSNISKKNWITWLVIIILFIFAIFFQWIIDFIYWMSNWILWFLDASRVN